MYKEMAEICKNKELNMYISSENMIKTIEKLDKYFSNSDINEVANVEFPNEIEYKSNEWLYYIFYSCLLDYGMRSKIYHNNLINTYHNYKDIFNPQYILNNFNNHTNILQQIIKENIHPRYPNIAVNKWIKLSAELSKYNSLLEHIKSFKTFKELNKFVKNINGYGQKTGGLLLRLIYESNICNFSDDISTIPLDRHDIEISYLNEIINTKTLTSKQIKELSDAYIKYSNKININPNKVDKYLWEIGSKFCDKKDCENCPLCSNCSTKIKETAL